MTDEWNTKTALLSELTQLVATSNKLLKTWEKLHDDDWPTEGYPDGWPSFDEVANQLAAWREALKKKPR